MKSHDEMISSVFEIGEHVLDERRRCRTIAVKTACAAFGVCAAAALGIGFWSSSAVRNAADPDPFSAVSIIDETTTESTEQHSSEPQATVTAAPTTAPPETASLTTFISQTTTQTTAVYIPISHMTASTATTSAATTISTAPTTSSAQITTTVPETTVQTIPNTSMAENEEAPIFTSLVDTPEIGTDIPKIWSVGTIYDFNGVKYTSHHNGYTTLDQVERLGTAEVEIIHLDGTVETVNVEIYKIHGTLIARQIGVKYPNDEKIYFFYKEA